MYPCISIIGDGGGLGSGEGREADHKAGMG